MNLAERLIEADRASPKRILVIGDGMTDVYVQGRMERCQDGCPKFIEEGEVYVSGGAANAAHSISCWWSEATFYGQHPGPVKTRFVIDGKYVFRHDDESDNGFDLDTIRKWALRALKQGQPHAVLLSDYDKGMLTPEFIGEVATLCRKQDIPCVADTKRPPEVYAGAILKGNMDWCKRCGWCDVVTRGASAPMVREHGGSFHTVGGNLPDVPCKNHVGAGDCFAAHLVLALAHGYSLRDAAAVAHSAGRVYVQSPHNRPPRPEEIAADLTRRGEGG